MKPFRKVLIANRGEIALRIVRSCRAMGIHTAVVFADPDEDAPFVRAADESVYIGAPMSGSSFLAIDTILGAARRVGADAIHPGYGFLAENADFAQTCADAGVVFIGPSPEAIRAMGSKIAAKEMIAAAAVPVIPGFSLAGASAAQIEAQARELGYPILLKASAGGGGKGMRIVRDGAALAGAVASAQREARGAFGDDTLLVERYFDSPRHIEIQILGDLHGTLVHCFERECSIQRRYQKIIEEAPSPFVDEDLRARMTAAAVTAGRTIGYTNAGTVEFVVDRDGGFYFLEMNTRLQVEHPVTEEITGLDLVRLQILVAQGAYLPFRQEDLRIRGHAIECRIYAEDPYNDFLPSTGTIACWEEAVLPGLRYDSGITTGSAVTIHYDPMLAKVIAHAPTRQEAAAKLAKGLGETRIHGIHTNLPLLQRILLHPEFLAGNLDTHFIENHVSLERRKDDAAAAADATHAVAAALWLQEHRRANARLLAGIPSGWRNNPSQMQETRFHNQGEMIEVRYRLLSRRHIAVEVGEGIAKATVQACNANSIDLLLDDVRRTYRVVAGGDLLYVSSPLGNSELHIVPRFPEALSGEIHGGCLAPMPGRVLAVRVEAGQAVKKGDPLVVLEAMKMEHEVVAPADATVQSVAVEVGMQVESGDVLVVLEDAAEATNNSE